MINIILNLLLIQLIVVFIVDLSGIIDTIKHFIWKRWIKIGNYQSISLKPFSCSLCSTWWCCLIYLLITSNLNLLTIAITALLAFLAGTLGDFLLWCKDAITKFINLLYKLID